jgi:hypothetical protein
MDLILNVILLSMMLWIYILGGRTCMSWYDLVDGNFGGISPTWALIREGIPPVGCHGLDLAEVHEMNVSFGGKGRDLGGSHLALAIQTIFLWRLKHHFRGLDITLGLGFWW